MGATLGLPETAYGMEAARMAVAVHTVVLAKAAEVYRGLPVDRPSCLGAREVA